jgi:NAD(P)-dependent dehydrogenase (short-subunit alcohol dehydrogenase family)
MPPLYSPDLSGRVAFITGASKGIGLAIARGLAQAGARVVISSRKADGIEAAAQTLQSEQLDVYARVCHTGSLASIHEAISWTASAFGRLDILVNNAATNPFYGPIQEADERLFDKIMEVNVRGPFSLSKAAYPLLKASGAGSILNISSVEALRPDAGLGLYSMSKAALLSLTQVLAKEWGPDGIRVNTMCPGIVKTKFSEALWSDETLMRELRRKVPLGRIATPDEMAGLALFLVSDAASYCTGGIYLADGGYVLA